MKRLFGLALLSSALANYAAAQTAPAIARYVPSAPDRAHVFVMDSAHILSPSTIAALQDSSLALQTSTHADIAWVTLPTLGGRPIEAAALYIGRTWHIGPKGEAGDPVRNRGLVVLYVPDKTKTAGSNFRVEVGNGLEGTITDSRSRSITSAMRDDLRAKQYDAAYMKGWTAAASLVREDFANTAGTGGVANTGARAIGATPVPPVKHSADGDESFEKVVLIGLLLFFLVAIIGWIRASILGKGQVYVGGTPRSSGEWDAGAFSDSGSSGITESGGGDSGGGDFGGGDFGGGGGFSGGGSSDSI